MKYVLASTDPISEFQRRGGGKALNLSRMTRASHPVPPWFCLTADALDRFVAEHDLGHYLDPVARVNELQAFAAEVETLFVAHELPEDVRRELEEQLDALGLGGEFLAVRSSGLDEDAPGHSFAGQFSSFLFQKGMAALSESIRRAWASGYSERALHYRMASGLSPDRIRVGIVVQLMVDASAAGVAFSRDPMHPLDRDHLIVESVPGLGEGLVSGELDADRFTVDRRTLEVTRSVIARKEAASRRGVQGGVAREALPESLRLEPSLPPERLSEIAGAALALESELGVPQDCEWVIDHDGALFLVQTRPITTLPRECFFDASVNGRQPSLWDNSNIIESYSGVTSPLTFSFANRAYTQVYVQFCRVMGVPARTIDANDAMYRNMLGLVRGRFYYNLVNWYRLIQMLPLAGRSAGFMETMMGVRQELGPEVRSLFDFLRHPPRYSFPRRAWVAGMTLWRFVRIESIVRQFLDDFEKAYRGSRNLDYNAMPLPSQVQHYRYLEDRVLKRWQAPIINDYLCMIFFGLLKRLTGKWMDPGDGGDSLQNDLLCGQGGLESTKPTKQLMRIAEWVDRQDWRLAHWLQSASDEEAWRQMRDENAWPELKRRVDAYLDSFGFRCVDELKLEQKDLHEDPSFIIAAIRRYQRGKTYDIDAMEHRERTIRTQAELRVNGRLRGLRRVAFNWVLGHARRTVRNRENLRFARTKIFGIARHLFRAMGRHLVSLDALDEVGDVFYLTVEELLGYVEGRPASADLRATAALRRREFEEYRRSPPPPDRFLTYGAVGASIVRVEVLSDGDLLREDASREQDPEMLFGTPCCPGVVEGTVRVVHRSEDATGIDGEILVTHRTDPGWVPLYPSCSGLLIERGSLLSHSAVVARELGLPTIVGISGGLLERLHTGQRVRMDAGSGQVRILS